MKINKRLRIVYRGNVQGVGFRFAANHLAKIYDIGGYVRNEPDGSVLIIAEGTQGCLETFMKDMESSHMGGYIRDIAVETETYTGEYDDFRIEY